MTARNASAKRLDNTFDVGCTDKVVDADFVLECAQEHVQAVQAVLTGMRPVLANFYDDFSFVITLFIAGVLEPELCTVELVRARERKRLYQFNAFGVAVVLEVGVVVEPPLVFFHGVIWTQR